MLLLFRLLWYSFSLLCQPSLNCASARLRGGGGRRQHGEVVPTVSAAAGADALLGLSAAGVLRLWL